MPTIALHYVTPGDSWVFEGRRDQPIPVVEFGAIQTTKGAWSTNHWWVAWIPKESVIYACPT